MKLSPLLRVAVGAAATVGLVGCSTLTGASTVVPGSGAGTVQATATAAGTSGGAATAGGTAGGGAGAALLAKVVPLPVGARGWTRNRTGVLGLDDFIQGFYKQSAWSSQKPQVQRRGFVTSARHGWFDTDGTQAEVFLVRFTSAQGAKSMYLSVTSGWTSAGSATTTFTDPAVHGRGELERTLDSVGDMTAKDATCVGDVFVYVMVFDPASANKAAVTALAARQYALLKPGQD